MTVQRQASTRSFDMAYGGATSQPINGEETWRWASGSGAEPAGTLFETDALN
jgi:hypothetical protein